MAYRLVALMVLLVALTPTLYGQDTPCANVYLYNSTIKGEVTPVADQVAALEIVNRLQSWSGLCFKGFLPNTAALYAWQTSPRATTDVLVDFNVGPLPGGRTEIIAYDVMSYNRSVKKIVNSGPSLVWFDISRDEHLMRFRAWRAASEMMFSVAVMATEGKLAK